MRILFLMHFSLTQNMPCTKNIRPIFQVTNAIKELDGPHQQVVCDCYVSRRDELKRHLTQAACNLSNSYLKDFDWQLKVGKLLRMHYNYKAVVMHYNYKVSASDSQSLIGTSWFTVHLSNNNFWSFYTWRKNKNKLFSLPLMVQFLVRT